MLIVGLSDKKSVFILRSMSFCPASRLSARHMPVPVSATYLTSKLVLIMLVLLSSTPPQNVLCSEFFRLIFRDNRFKILSRALH